MKKNKFLLINVDDPDLELMERHDFYSEPCNIGTIKLIKIFYDELILKLAGCTISTQYVVFPSTEEHVYRLYRKIHFVDEELSNKPYDFIQLQK